jgi:hypothetical protein
MLVSVPTFPDAGLPVSEPVVVLKVAQAGLWAILKVTRRLLVVTAGVNEYSWPTTMAVAGEPLMVSDEPTGCQCDADAVAQRTRAQSANVPARSALTAWLCNIVITLDHDAERKARSPWIEG